MAKVATAIHSGAEDQIAISGISCRLPESDNMAEFRDHLMKGEDMVTEDDRRWPPGLHDLPRRNGKLKDITKFDAAFFNVLPTQADAMDPGVRLMLEVAYETVADSGTDPVAIQGSNTGVFIGTMGLESIIPWTRDAEKIIGYEMTGCSPSMLANRLTYFFNFKGPSLCTDTACSSSLTALNLAVHAMRNGSCDAAIVGGCNLCVNPNTSVQLLRLGVLSDDGKCKSFDSSGKGYVRSEGVVCIYLQKRKLAKRIYSTILHIATNSDGKKPEGLLYPSGDCQKKLLERVYTEAGIDPTDVAYVECHATGTRAGDPEESNAVCEVFCKNRKGPLLIGSTKSNCGHTEAVSGLTSLAKVIIAMEEGIIPANLHFMSPNLKIPGLSDGRLKVVSENTPWTGGVVGLNSFGFGGTNVHVILQSHDTLERLTPKLDKTSRIFTFAGRTEAAVEHVLKFAQREGITVELQDLLQASANGPPSTLPYRGFTILNTEEPRWEIQHCQTKPCPVWYIFNGMGSQWVGMGRDMMKVYAFRASIVGMDGALRRYGIHLYDLIHNGDENAIQDVILSSVMVVAIQVALVDALSSLGLLPDGLIGHSVGEVACGYADGCLTAEQAVLTAYWRAYYAKQAHTSPGAMAAIGLTWEEAKKQCPSDIHPACHNTKDSITVSGNREAITKFVTELDNQKVFARMVDTAGIAFHSPTMAKIAPSLEMALRQVITAPKPRTDRWISTSYPEMDWKTNLAKHASPSYYVNNLTSPVLFKEALEHVPDHAVIIEVGPHCLLQTLLKRSLGAQCAIVALMSKKVVENLDFFKYNIGKIFINGVNFNPWMMNPPVLYPVPRMTPMVSPFIQWDHSAPWRVVKAADFSAKPSTDAIGSIFEINISEESDSHVLRHSDHVIDGSMLYPGTGYLVLAWKTLAKNKGQSFNEMPVQIEDFAIHRATTLPRSGALQLKVNISDERGEFSVRDNQTCVASGRIFAMEQLSAPPQGETTQEAKSLTKLASKDIYKELGLRGYEYGPTFQGLLEVNNEAINGLLLWKNEWVTFLDAMLQTYIIGKFDQGLHLPTRIRSIKIDPNVHLSKSCLKRKSQTMKAVVNHNMDSCIAGGVEMTGIHTIPAPRRQSTLPVHQEYHFFPYMQTTPTEYQQHMQRTVGTHLTQNEMNIKHKESEANQSVFLTQEKSLAPLLQVVMQNIPTRHLAIVGIGTNERAIACEILAILNSRDEVTIDYTIIMDNISTPGHENTDMKVVTWDMKRKIPPEVAAANLVVVSVETNITHANSDGLADIATVLQPGAFLLVMHKTQNQPSLSGPRSSSSCDINSSEKWNQFLLEFKLGTVSVTSDMLLIRKKNIIKEHQAVLSVDSSHFDWVEGLKSALQKQRLTPKGENLWLLALSYANSGVIGMLNCLRKEPGGDRLRCIFNGDLDELPLQDLSPESGEFHRLIEKDLVMNVWRNGQWGSFLHLPAGNETTIRTEHAYLNILQPGDLSSLRWIQSPVTISNPLARNIEAYSVFFASLNFRDVMLATGKLPPESIPRTLVNQDCLLGMEFSGRDKNGKRIMGILPAKGLATTVAADTRFTWEVPDSWSLEDAATVPVVYATAYYALVVRGGLQRNDTILIHSGSGGVGQAAISVALSYDCQVFTTVGSAEKRENLMKTFPQLTSDGIFNSRDTSFEKDIMLATQGKGVKMVLNSLAGEKLQASIRLLATHGTFLEIGKYDLSQNTPMGMAIFLQNITFHGILLDALFDEGNRDWEEVSDFLTRGIQNGVVRPLKTTVFDMEKVEEAFRFMAHGKHIGKVVIRIRDEKLITPSAVSLLAIPRTTFYPEKSYLITGGLGGFGMELAQWLIDRGACNIILTSRSGLQTGYQSWKMRKWREKGINVQISNENVATSTGTQKLIVECEKQGQVGGVFHLAMVLHDGLLVNLTREDFLKVAEPKAFGAIHLDKATRSECRDSLDWFVVFSSMSAGIGNSGQANYGYANSSMERVCEKRRHDGLQGLAIQWGLIGDVGVVMDTMNGFDTELLGTTPQRLSSCLNTLDQFMNQTHTVMYSFVRTEKIHGTRSSTNTSAQLEEAVANIIGVKDVSKVSTSATFAELGVDSLISASVQQILENDYKTVMSAKDVSMLTFQKLKEMENSNTD